MCASGRLEPDSRATHRACATDRTKCSMLYMDCLYGSASRWRPIQPADTILALRRTAAFLLYIYLTIGFVRSLAFPSLHNALSVQPLCCFPHNFPSYSLPHHPTACHRRRRVAHPGRLTPCGMVRPLVWPREIDHNIRHGSWVGESLFYTRRSRPASCLQAMQLTCCIPVFGEGITCEEKCRGAIACTENDCMHFAGFALEEKGARKTYD